MKPEEHARKVTKIIAKAWMDEGFKARLLSDPMATLKEEGVEIPPGVEVRIAVDTDNVRHLLLPMKPAGEELSDAQLADVAAGTAIEYATLSLVLNSCGSICAPPPKVLTGRYTT
jgi:hypothetical protein